MSKSKRKTHFVPKAVFRTAFAGVIPVCVAGVACGGAETTGGNGTQSTQQSSSPVSISSSSSSTVFLGVGASCFGSNCFPGASTSYSSSKTSTTFFAVAATFSSSSSTSHSSVLDAAPDHTVPLGDAADDARDGDGGETG